MRHPIVITRRAALAGGTTAILGGVALAAVGLGAASAQQEPTVATVQTMADGVATTTQDAVFAISGSVLGGAPTGVEDLQAQQKKYVDTLAAKLGTTSDKLQAAIDATSKETGFPGPFPLMGAPGVRVELSFATDQAAVALALGMSEADLAKALANSSIADVARARGVDRQVVATALKNAHSAALDKAVKDGKLSQDIADKLRANLDNEVQMLLDIKRGPGGLFSAIRIEKAVK